MKFATVTWYSQLTAVILGVVIFVLGIYIGTQISEPTETVIRETESPPKPISEVQNTRIVSLKLGSKVIDGTTEFPKSEVFATATYTDGTTKIMTVKDVQGSCDFLEPDIALGRQAEELLCYYAGFGEVFRIIETDIAYGVETKEIEEASPDYNPPIAEFRTLFEIPK